MAGVQTPEVDAKLAPVTSQRACMRVKIGKKNGNHAIIV
jgi:hypothetical protein